MLRIPSSIHGYILGRNVTDRRGEEEKAEKTWRDSRADKQVALELQPSTGMGVVPWLKLLAVPGLGYPR